MANYLPVLLVSVSTNAIPDDSSVSTLPRGQVDYLSHDWQEEDVWRSWRRMTRQKNEIANGIRLENASWRTWWKQRNKLKTVTPETLNWLKDSDVTWLYGPLHTAGDWAPLPKPSETTRDALDLHTTKKPILKHRSISEFLTSDLPSPLFSPVESEEEQEHAPVENAANVSTERPPLMHTKSDTHITRWGPSRAFRKDSPPRVQAEHPNNEDVPTRRNTKANAAALRKGTSETDLAPVAKKKHISFNTFVEQCIAIEKPKKLDASAAYESIYRPRHHSTVSYDNGYDDDSEGYDSYFPQDRFDSPPSNTDSEEDDDVLEMRRTATPARRPANGRSSSSSSSSASSGRSHGLRRNSYNARPPLLRQQSTDKAHVTIAPIAPTILKTRGTDEADGESQEPYTGRDLVYVPPFGSNYCAPPGVQSPPMFFSSPVMRSPSLEEDAYDYFSGPDLGEDFEGRRSPRRHRYSAVREIREDDSDGIRRSRAPEVVVNGVDDAPEERQSRSRSRSRSRTPSPIEISQPISASYPKMPSPTPTVAIPRSASRGSPNSSLLSPPDAHPSRGRSNADTPRGRSVATSVESRARSSSRGTSSSLGSISPEGSAVGVGYGYSTASQGRGRSREDNGRQISASLSPDDMRSPTHALPDSGDLSCSSTSTSSSSSTRTIRPSVVSSPIPLPSPILEESEEERSKRPSPVNPSSPTSSFPHILTLNFPNTSQMHANGTISWSPPSSPTGHRRPIERDGTLVGRAVDIVSSAGAFLGSMWHG